MDEDAKRGDASEAVQMRRRSQPRPWVQIRIYRSAALPLLLVINGSVAKPGKESHSHRECSQHRHQPGEHVGDGDASHLAIPVGTQHYV